MDGCGRDLFICERINKMDYDAMIKLKKKFLEGRTFFEKLCDSRTLLNRKRWLNDQPLLESVDEKDLDKVKKILDDLQDKNIIGDWVIGGGTALIYYTDAIPTIDIDVFSYYTSASIFAPLGDLYEYMKDKYSAEVDGEAIKVNGLYLQFLPADSTNPVDEEAVKHPLIIKNGLKIFKLEYLICSMLYLKSQKYMRRLPIVKDEQKYDEQALRKLLKKFNLEKEWEKI